MTAPDLKQMLNAGVHFGHQTLRWNPKMEKYILTERNGIHIIDLSQTQECFTSAVEGIKKVLESGRKILFVGTKKSVKHCVEEEAKRCGMFYVTNRWLGGMLTNFTTVKNSIKTIVDIEQMEENGLLKELKKKEIIALKKRHQKLNNVLGGIRDMATLPGLVFAVDTKNDYIAVKEAIRLNIPVVAIVDSNSNPDNITYPIPGNDDAIKSVSLLVKCITDAIVEFSQNELIPAEKETEETSITPEEGTGDSEKGKDENVQDSGESVEGSVAPPEKSDAEEGSDVEAESESDSTEPQGEEPSPEVPAAETITEKKEGN
jgi:small subunit ribosomal protein S2